MTMFDRLAGGLLHRLHGSRRNCSPLSERAYSEANRIAWEQAAPKHEEASFENWAKLVQEADFNCFPRPFNDEIDAIGLRGKAVAHLCCHNGRHLVSAANLGAERCVGFDISQAMLEQARTLAEISGTAGEWVCCDVLQIGGEWLESFDRVLFTSGTLLWVSDINRFFEVVHAILKPGGILYGWDMHPCLRMVADDYHRQANPLKRLADLARRVLTGETTCSYFDRGPCVENSGMDYYSRRSYSSSPAYFFHHTLGDILSACCRAGLRIDHLREGPEDVSGLYRRRKGRIAKMPLNFSVAASRPTEAQPDGRLGEPYLA